MENKKLKKLKQRFLLDPLKKKKELIAERIEKLDPNNKETQEKPLIKTDSKRKVHNDGFEHRTSKETTERV